LSSEENKQYLGQDPLMVIFLQSIELERLKKDNDSWRYRQSDYERKLQESSRLEDSIRGLSLEHNEHKTKNQILTGENERLK